MVLAGSAAADGIVVFCQQSFVPLFFPPINQSCYCTNPEISTFVKDLLMQHKYGSLWEWNWSCWSDSLFPPTAMMSLGDTNHACDYLVVIRRLYTITKCI